MASNEQTVSCVLIMDVHNHNIRLVWYSVGPDHHTHRCVKFLLLSCPLWSNSDSVEPQRCEWRWVHKCERGNYLHPQSKGGEEGSCHVFSHMEIRVSFALYKKCWVCAKWLLHSTVAGLASSPFSFWACFEAVTVECSNHFPHTQQFLPYTKLTLVEI